MFTGLVEAVGQIARVENRGRDRRLIIEPGDALMKGLEVGDSVAVSGPCLTVIDPGKDEFAVDVSAETLAHTTLGERKAGDRVNLERALLPTDRLGGHLVSGHVDAVAEVQACESDGNSWRFTISAPDHLARYIAPKGSVCLDGISLTVNEVDGAAFGVNIIPHTMTVTTFADAVRGTRLNLEVDLVARYLERLLTGRGADDSSIDHELLRRTGFLDKQGGN